MKNVTLDNVQFSSRMRRGKQGKREKIGIRSKVVEGLKKVNMSITSKAKGMCSEMKYGDDPILPSIYDACSFKNALKTGLAMTEQLQSHNSLWKLYRLAWKTSSASRDWKSDIGIIMSLYNYKG